MSIIIESINIGSNITLSALDNIHGLVNKMSVNPIDVTRTRFMPGVEHLIQIGKEIYTVKVLYAKNKTTIKKICITFKVVVA